MQEENMFIHQSAGVLIYFSSSHVQLLLEVSALLIKCSKTVYFSKKPRRLLPFDLKHAKFIRGSPFSIILCFSKKRLGTYFCPSYTEGGVLSSIYGLDSI